MLDNFSTNSLRIISKATVWETNDAEKVRQKYGRWKRELRYWGDKTLYLCTSKSFLIASFNFEISKLRCSAEK